MKLIRFESPEHSSKAVRNILENLTSGKWAGGYLDVRWVIAFEIEATLGVD